MSTARQILSPETCSLLEQERMTPLLPVAARARVLARARAALAAGIAAEPVWAHTAAQPPWAVVASVLFLTSAAVGAAVYEIRARFQPAPLSGLAVPLATPATPPALAAASVTAPVSDPRAAPVPGSAGGRRRTRTDAAPGELGLLQQARVAVARRDFAAALPRLADHVRIFKNGRFAEEREALRVRALAGLGRMDEACRVAAAFEARFPRSVLLPALSCTRASER